MPPDLLLELLGNKVREVKSMTPEVTQPGPRESYSGLWRRLVRLSPLSPTSKMLDALGFL